MDETAALEKLASLAGEAGAAEVAAEALALLQRVREQRFYVACLGQCKRGKSSLINALLAAQVVPVGVTPVTNVPVVVRYGEQPAARVRKAKGEWQPIAVSDLEHYVSEDRNPANREAISVVEVFWPAALLREGLCLVDTPGVGSVFVQSSEAARAFVPHTDAAIVVIGADPPLAADELALIESAAALVPEMIFVLNKADRVSDEERAQAKKFAVRIVQERLGHGMGAVLEVSATEKLAGLPNQRDWLALAEKLRDLSGQSSMLSAAAGARGLRRLCGELHLLLSEERRALTVPLEESRRRVEAMSRTLRDLETSLSELSLRLTAEQVRLSQQFAQHQQEFLMRTQPAAEVELRSRLREVPRRLGPAFRRAVMEQAQRTAQAHVMPWLEAEQDGAERAYSDVEERFHQMARDYLRSLSDAGIADVSAMLREDEGFRVRSRFHFYEFLRLARPASPLRYLADMALGAAQAYAPIEHDARQFLRHSLETNASRVSGDLDERVLESRRGVEAEIRSVLGQARALAERALQHATVAHEAGGPGIELALQQISRREAQLAAIGQS